MLWITLPALMLSVDPFTRPSRLSRPRLYAVGRNPIRAISRRSGPHLASVAGCLTVSTSVQTARVLRPVITELKSRSGPARALTLPPLRPIDVVRRQKHVLGFVSLLIASCRRNAAHVSARALEDVGNAYMLFRRAQEVIRSVRPKVLVVATQHNSATRAFLLAAREYDIPTIYLPHAPVADNIWYEDLPVHAALLRGVEEMAYYLRLGADSAGIRIVGDPSRSHGVNVRAPLIGPPIWAPPSKPSEIRQATALLWAAGLEEVVVAPHPRADPRSLCKICPSSWEINVSSSTHDRLTAGTSVFIQSDSGAGLEALQLGLPVLNLMWPGRRANYPYLNTEFVINVHSSTQLASALGSLDVSQDATDSRRAYAGRWCERAGSDAVGEAATAIEQVRDDVWSRSRLINDIWNCLIDTGS